MFNMRKKRTIIKSAGKRLESEAKHFLKVKKEHRKYRKKMGETTYKVLCNQANRNFKKRIKKIR